jgi:hypothetical protein
MRKPEMDEKAETARLAYREAREEILQRIAHRDRTMIAFLGATGALFAAIVAAESKPFESLYVIAVLALGAANVVSQHSLGVATLVSFIRNELVPYMEKQGLNTPVWDDSEALRGEDKNNVTHRSWGEVTVFVGTLVAVLTVNVSDAFAFPGWKPALWWLCLLALFAILVIYCKQDRRRRRLLK